MSVNRKQQAAQNGRALARWLNRDPGRGEDNRIVAQMRLTMLLHLSRRGSIPVEPISRAANCFLDALGLPYLDPSKEPPPGLNRLAAGFLRGEALHTYLREAVPMRVSFRVETNPQGRGIAVTWAPEDEAGRWLGLFKELCDSGDISRVRFCRNCQRFFYCAGRLNRKTCSVVCRVGLWEKTPNGRKRKREYMREWRATKRKLWEAKQKGRELKRGRKLHTDLKKGE